MNQWPPPPIILFLSSGREFDVKALCEGAGGDPDEEELSPDSACSAESQASHRDQPHDRELLSFFLLYSMWFVKTFDLENDLSL